MRRHLFFLSIFSSFIITHSAFADSSSWFPYLPRISGTPWVSNNQDVLQGDAMAALFGNDQNIIWGDVVGKNALDSSWSGGLGAGYRYVYNDERILGAYVYGDSSHALNGGHTFWDVSPGLESLGRLWDFRVNGYFPVNKKSVFISQGFADTFNQFQFVVFSGHNQYDRLLDLYQAVGNGVDGEVGRFIVPGLTAYVGGYYFGAGASSSDALVNPQTVHGVSARAQYEFNSHTALELSNTYDNVLHDTILGGIRFTLGGMNNSSQDRSDISSRLLDPIERELATQGQGTAIPVQNQLVLGGLALERGNIWFFTPGGSPLPSQAGAVTVNANSCTFEHPCSTQAFNQDNVTEIGNIAPGANFYLATGDYTDDGGSIGDPLQLSSGQSLFGRMPGFVESASGSNRPILTGAIALPANSLDTIDSVQLLNDGTSSNFGISLVGNDIAIVTNSLVGADSNGATAFDDGINIKNDDNRLLVSGSAINGMNNGGSFRAGIDIDGTDNGVNPSHHANHNTITVINSSVKGGVCGIWLDGAFANLFGSASGTGANANIIAVTNSLINGELTAGIFVSGLDANFSGSGGNNGANGNSITLTDSQVSGESGIFFLAQLANVLGSGNGNGTNGNRIISTNSQIIGEITGISIQGGFAGASGNGSDNGVNENTIIFMDTTVSASNGGILVIASGAANSGSSINNGANGNIFTLDSSHINIAASSGNAYGILNDGGNNGVPDGSAINNTYNIINGSTINVTNTGGNAFGIADSYANDGTNTWNVSPSSITVSATGTACRESFNGVCVVP